MFFLASPAPNFVWNPGFQSGRGRWGEQGWNPNHRTQIHKVKWMQNLLEQDLPRTIARLPFFFFKLYGRRQPSGIFERIWFSEVMSTDLVIWMLFRKYSIDKRGKCSLWIKSHKLSSCHYELETWVSLAKSIWVAGIYNTQHGAS